MCISVFLFLLPVFIFSAKVKKEKQCLFSFFIFFVKYKKCLSIFHNLLNLKQFFKFIKKNFIFWVKKYLFKRKYQHFADFLVVLSWQLACHVSLPLCHFSSIYYFLKLKKFQRNHSVIFILLCKLNLPCLLLFICTPH